MGQAVEAVGSIDQGKLAEYLHKTPFKTVIGEVKFGPLGESETSAKSCTCNTRTFGATTLTSSGSLARP